MKEEGEDRNALSYLTSIMPMTRRSTDAQAYRTSAALIRRSKFHNCEMSAHLERVKENTCRRRRSLVTVLPGNVLAIHSRFGPGRHQTGLRRWVTSFQRTVRGRELSPILLTVKVRHLSSPRQLYSAAPGCNHAVFTRVPRQETTYVDYPYLT